VRNEVIPLDAQNIQFQQQDPSFAKLVQVINDCMNFVVAQDQEGHIDQLDNNRKFTCDKVISQGVEQFCGFSATSDIAKCEQANEMQLYYLVTAGAAGFST
jgi:predicted P-loop ATPase